MPFHVVWARRAGNIALGHVPQTGPAPRRYIPENITIIPPEAELGSTVVDNVKNFFTNKLKAIGK